MWFCVGEMAFCARYGRRANGFRGEEKVEVEVLNWRKINKYMKVLGMRVLQSGGFGA